MILSYGSTYDLADKKDILTIYAQTEALLSADMSNIFDNKYWEGVKSKELELLTDLYPLSVKNYIAKSGGVKDDVQKKYYAKLLDHKNEKLHNFSEDPYGHFLSLLPNENMSMLDIAILEYVSNETTPTTFREKKENLGRLKRLVTDAGYDNFIARKTEVDYRSPGTNGGDREYEEISKRGEREKRFIKSIEKLLRTWVLDTWKNQENQHVEEWVKGNFNYAHNKKAMEVFVEQMNRYLYRQIENTDAVGYKDVDRLINGHVQELGDLEHASLLAGIDVEKQCMDTYGMDIKDNDYILRRFRNIATNIHALGVRDFLRQITDKTLHKYIRHIYDSFMQYLFAKLGICMKVLTGEKDYVLVHRMGHKGSVQFRNDIFYIVNTLVEGEIPQMQEGMYPFTQVKPPSVFLPFYQRLTDVVNKMIPLLSAYHITNITSLYNKIFPKT